MHEDEPQCGGINSDFRGQTRCQTLGNGHFHFVNHGPRARARCWRTATVVASPLDGLHDGLCELDCQCVRACVLSNCMACLCVLVSFASPIFSCRKFQGAAKSF